MNFVPLPRGRWPGEHQFYFGMALALLAAVVLGFARSFFLLVVSGSEGWLRFAAWLTGLVS